MISAMRVFGLTGGIGSGKSTVADLFRVEGIPVVDADRISRDISRPGTPAYEEIIRHFGRAILHPDGRIDRKLLGEIVFEEPDRRALLESITHPRIADGIREAISGLEAQGHEVAVVEAALIHEIGRRGTFQAVIGIRCDRETQIGRLTRRDGVSREAALRIVSSQMDPEEKARASDYVIDNSGDLEETRAQVRALVAAMRNR